MLRPIIATAILLLNALAVCSLNPRADIAEKPARAGGHYYAYPEDEISPEYGKTPQGYEAFYISHYGRHGSRYLTQDQGYTAIMDVLDRAARDGVITPQGRLLRAQLDTIYAEGRGRAGELSPLGRRQHMGIARRMAAAHPAVVDDSATITAESTVVMRCAHSMFAFIEALKEINPHLDIPRESSMRNMGHLNYSSDTSAVLRGVTGPYRQPWKKFRKRVANLPRLMDTFVNSQKYVADSIDALTFAEDLYYLASDMQSVDCGTDLSQWLTDEEMFGLWQLYNFKFYARYSDYAPVNGAFTDNARPILQHIVDNADKYISSGRHGATLRFGHDINLLPLTALMRIDGCYSDALDPENLSQTFANYRVVPMAANLQIVFYRPKGGVGDILTRIYLNERPATLPVETTVVDGTPYYRWNDLRSYLTNL